MKPSPATIYRLMATKYYTAKNCNRKIAGDKHEYPFEPYMLTGGVWWGLYSTSNKSEQKELTKVGGVTEMTKEEYEAENKKKQVPSGEFNPLPTLSSAKQSQQLLTVVEDVGPVQSVLKSSGEAKAAAEAKAKEVSVDTVLEVAPTDRISKRKK